MELTNVIIMYLIMAILFFLGYLLGKYEYEEDSTFNSKKYLQEGDNNGKIKMGK